MPWELIYTSSQRGLTSGQSGFCTVARTDGLRDGLAQRLEQISSYHHVQNAGAGKPGRNPVIAAYRILDLRGMRFHVLSRLLPCGLDFTSRTNHLAHHLVFSPDELSSLPSPAAILLHWSGWKSIWQGEPRLLDPLAAESFHRLPAPTWPAAAWQQLTGDAGRAAGLLADDLGRACYLIAPAGGEQLLLGMFAETLQLLNPTGAAPQRAWLHTFTTFLQGEDAAADFNWRGCQVGSPAYEQAMRRLPKPITLKAIRVPDNELARLAREGPAAPPPAPAPDATRTLTLQPSSPRASPARKSLDNFEPVAMREGADSHYLNISISQKSLIGVAVAMLLLAVFFFARKHDLWPSKRSADSPGSRAAGNAGQNSAGGRSVLPAPASASPSAARFDSERATRELNAVLPGVPTYLQVVPSLPNDEATLAAVPALAALLREFANIRVKPRDLAPRFDLNTWGGAPAFALSLESDPTKHKLNARSGDASHENDSFAFDYSELAGEPTAADTVRFRAKLEHEDPDSVSACAILFQPADSARENVDLPPFELVVINAAKPPAATTLAVDPGTLEATLRGPLGACLQQIRPADPYWWQLEPWVKIGGQIFPLYNSFPPDLRPKLGTELDLASEKQNLAQQRDDQLADAKRLEQKIADIRSIVQPAVKWDLPLGSMLGLTNNRLSSFANFSSNQPRSSDLFLKYLRRVASKAPPERLWLSSWPSYPDWGDPGWDANNPAQVLQQLDQLYNLCVQNLPKETAADLAISAASSSYFVEGWKSLSRDEAIQRFADGKQASEDAAQRLQKLMDLLPASLEELAEVRLYLVNGNNANSRLEVIRFTNPGKAAQP